MRRKKQDHQDDHVPTQFPVTTEVVQSTTVLRLTFQPSLQWLDKLIAFKNENQEMTAC